ncbi:MAG: glycosyltransferase family 2 protein [Actinomycetota bacterium]|nr:glycosyltransferase family 2 protein [Actinomycetota bacterium]
MSAPRLSVVVASVNGLPYLDECLDALTRRCPEAEVIVADWTNEATRRHVEQRWPSVQLLSFDEPKTVPELRAAGIGAAKGPYVALIEDHCLVRNGWAEGILARHGEGKAVVGGAIRNAATERIRDWAAFFCEYSEHMDPVTPGPADSLPGMNVSYDQQAIRAMESLLREGRWETWLHEHLRRCGFVLHRDPELTIEHAKEFGIREFVSQRYHYSRSYAGMRNAELGARRAFYLAGSPLLVPLAFARIVRNVLQRRRYRWRLAAASPLILVYTVVWAFGEAVGYAFGGGRSLLKVR